MKRPPPSSFMDSSVPSKKPTDNSSFNLYSLDSEYSSFESFPGSWVPCVQSLSHSRSSITQSAFIKSTKQQIIPPFEGLFYREVASPAKKIYKNLNSLGFRGKL